MNAYCAKDVIWKSTQPIRSGTQSIGNDRFGPIDMEALSRKAEGLTKLGDHFVLWADDTRSRSDFAFAAREDFHVLSSTLGGESRDTLLQRLTRFFKR